ncbi:MAG: GNAT family N-acetyltransferase [Firmicutes bacterium]|nr:GNAT family N-acetyltransferase [Bacillota bacterium]
MNKFTIRNIKKSEINQVAALVAKGYEGDIFFKWVVDSDEERTSVTTKYYKEYLKAQGCISHVAIDHLGEIVGATVWLPHDVDPKLYEEINKVVENYACNFQAVADASHENEPKGIPFYQLVGFVVDEKLRGLGLGEKLLAHQLSKLDKIGIPTYLEASTPYHGKGVYGKFGYQMHGDIMKFTESALLYPLFRDAKKKVLKKQNEVTQENDVQKHSHDKSIKNTWLEEFVQKNKTPKSVIGKLTKTKPLMISLGEHGEYIEKVKEMNQNELDEFLKNLLFGHGATWAISGDREFRHALYRHSGEEFMAKNLTIHVGVDIIAPSGTEIFAPYDGEITHVVFEEDDGGYGWLIAMKVENFYLLFGHLGKKDLPKVGEKVKAGDKIGTIGDFHENGEWFHHLHFQAMSKEGIDENLIFEALFHKKDMERADRISPSVMPIIEKWK